MNKVDKRKQPRDVEEAYAHANGFFWLPCPLCREYFGGHEDQGKRGYINYAKGRGSGTCINCTEETEAINKINGDWPNTVDEKEVEYDRTKTDDENQAIHDVLVDKAIKRGRDLIQAGKS